jgi:hypothetical protein
VFFFAILSVREEGSNSSRWIFSLKELHSATNNFNYDNKIGEGPFGSVYWGQLWDGTQVMIYNLIVSRLSFLLSFSSEIKLCTLDSSVNFDFS